MMKKRAGIVVTCGVFFVIAGLSLWWNRSTTIDLGKQGLAKAKLRWGRLDRIEWDRNRDGLVDAREVMKPGAWLELRESWDVELGSIDVDYNGKFDVWWREPEIGGVRAFVLWHDQDADGIPDTVMYGEEARKYLANVEMRSRGSEGDE